MTISRKDEAKARYLKKRGLVHLEQVNGETAAYSNATVPRYSVPTSFGDRMIAEASALLWFYADEHIVWINTQQMTRLSWSPTTAEGENK